VPAGQAGRLAVLWARALVAVLLLALALPRPAAAEVRAAAPDTFAAALSAAGPGDVLDLAPGDYGTLGIGGRRFAGAPLTIRSADPARPARFAALKLDRAEGLVLEGLVFAFRATPGKDQGRLRVSEINRSRAVTLRGCVFAGDVARGVGPKYDGFATAFGLAVRWSSDVTIEQSEFRTWFRGLVVGQSEGITLRGSTFHAIRSDGANFADVRRVLIERNTFRDFARAPAAGDHSDMIQFWTNGTREATAGITIRDNVFNSGRGLYTQSIFMRNEEVDTGRAGRAMFYRDVAITGNVIVNAHLHGITVGETAGLRIEANTLVRNPASAGGGNNVALWTPTIRVKPASERVTIRANVTPGIDGPDKRPDWTVQGNLIVQDRDPAAPGHYDAVFVAARTGDPRDLSSFAYLPGGPAARGVGAPALRLDRMAAGGAVALIRAERDPRFVNRFRFDAGLGRLPAGAEPVWRFGDGTEARGTAVEHTFAAPGRHRVTLAAGAARAAAEVTVPDPDLLRLPEGAGAFLARGRALGLPDLPLAPLPGGGQALRLGAGVVAIPAGHVAGLAGARDMDLSLRFRAESRAGGARDPSGEILRVHGILVVALTPTGSLRLQLATAGAAKPAVVTTAPLRLHDGRWHDARLRYDAARGEITVEIDGVLRSRARVAGAGAAAGGAPLAAAQRDLTFGNPFGKQSFSGLVSAFALSAGATGFAPAP
jgi:hypothetical protein